MRRTTTLLITLLLSTGALIPLAGASWKYRGMNEPDTLRDVEDGYMFLDPDQNTGGTPRVYFSGYSHVFQVWVNPNVGALGSRVQPGSEVSLSAFLGIWKDCNKDGYIGLGEAGLVEYRAELLRDTSVCPRQTVAPPPATPPDPYPFNDGAWIREFIWIGIDIDGKWRDVNPTFITVPNTKVWFDWGLPESAPGVTCPTTGAFSIRSTGAMVEWADCFSGYRGVNTLNAAQGATGLPVGGWDKRDIENSPNTCDVEDLANCKGLNVQNPVFYTLYGADGDGFGEGTLGRDHHKSGQRADRVVEVWDCSDPAKPKPNANPTVNPDGSAYELANETYYIVTSADDAGGSRCKHPSPGSTSNGGLQYPRLEGDSESTNADAGKERPSDHFYFSAGHRKRLSNGGGALGPYAPHDLGLSVERNLDLIGSSWRSNTLWGRDPPLVTRDGLEPVGAIYHTYYAKLGSTSGFALPLGTATSSYGRDAGQSCEGQTSGIHNGWNCAETKWTERCIKDETRMFACVVIGESYHLRDVDCWDGRIVAGVPVYASAALIAGDCGGGAETIDP